MYFYTNSCIIYINLNELRVIIMNKKTKIFIDGREGTTGLRIYDRLEKMDDIELIILKEDDRKNTEKRKEALNAAMFRFFAFPTRRP